MEANGDRSLWFNKGAENWEIDYRRREMTKKLIGQAAASLIVCTLAAITGVAMMVLAGNAIKE